VSATIAIATGGVLCVAIGLIVAALVLTTRRGDPQRAGRKGA
jgi:hypothetical protein